MAQYIMALLGRDPFGGMFEGGGPQSGRMGDYVFNQEGLQPRPDNCRCIQISQHLTKL
jgi:hypothetical protein